MAIEDEDIEELAQAPKRVTGDEGTVEERSIEELIEADRYTKAKQAGSGPPYGIRLARHKKPGTP